MASESAVMPRGIICPSRAHALKFIAKMVISKASDAISSSAQKVTQLSFGTSTQPDARRTTYFRGDTSFMIS
jgi:hypothetical protein